MVFEYMEFGDLAALLQANDPVSGVTPKTKLVEVGFKQRLLIKWLIDY